MVEETKSHAHTFPTPARKDSIMSTLRQFSFMGAAERKSSGAYLLVKKYALSTDAVGTVILLKFESSNPGH